MVACPSCSNHAPPHQKCNPTRYPLHPTHTQSDGVEAAIRWALGPEGGVGGKAAEVLAEVLAKKDAPPRSECAGGVGGWEGVR